MKADDGGGFFSGVKGVMITAGRGWRGCKLEILIDAGVPVVYRCKGWETKNWGCDHEILRSSSITGVAPLSLFWAGY